MDLENAKLSPLASDISGLDALRGGFPPDCLYMLSGTPGTAPNDTGARPRHASQREQ
jgi:hypothetical protein